MLGGPSRATTRDCSGVLMSIQTKGRATILIGELVGKVVTAAVQSKTAAGCRGSMTGSVKRRPRWLFLRYPPRTGTRTSALVRLSSQQRDDRQVSSRSPLFTWMRGLCRASESGTQRSSGPWVAVREPSPAQRITIYEIVDVRFWTMI